MPVQIGPGPPLPLGGKPRYPGLGYNFAVQMTTHDSMDRAVRWVASVGYWGAITCMALLAILIGYLAAAIAPGASATTLQNFFGLAIQVDASFLVAVFVVASFLLPRLPDPARKSYS